MFRKLVTTPASSTEEIREFFNNCAPAYSEQHGNPERLLNYRISLIKQYAEPRDDDVVLDIGCGNGHHLLALAGEIGRGIGVDLSPEMIGVAKRRLEGSPWQSKLTFRSDNGEELSTLGRQSIDLAICIGAFEHMLNKADVLASTHRVLKPGGRFFCLTAHGGYLWYRVLAPLLGLQTKHLSTDRFLKPDEFMRLLTESGFRRVQMGFWTFIPKADMPAALGFVFGGLDAIGRVFRMNSLRGGMWARAEKGE
jgi:SAM-dependent methyltransferase